MLISYKRGKRARSETQILFLPIRKPKTPSGGCWDGASFLVVLVHALFIRREVKLPFIVSVALLQIRTTSVRKPDNIGNKERQDLTRQTHQVIYGDDFLQQVWKQGLGLQVGVLVGKVEEQKRAVVRTHQSRTQGQDALLEVGHGRKATQLFKGHNGILQRRRKNLSTAPAD